MGTLQESNGLTSSSSRKGSKSKQSSLKMYCLADRNVVRVPFKMLIEAGLGAKTISVPVCSSGGENNSVKLSKAQGWWGF